MGEGIRARVHKSNAWTKSKDLRGNTERRPNLYLNLAILLGFLSLKSYLCGASLLVFSNSVQLLQWSQGSYLMTLLSILKWFQHLSGLCQEAESQGTRHLHRYCSSRFPVFVCLFNTHLGKWWVLVVRSGKNFAIWGFLAKRWPWWKQSGLFLHWGSKQNCPPPHSKRAKPQAAGPLLQFFPIDKWHKVLFRPGSGARHLRT